MLENNESKPDVNEYEDETQSLKGTLFSTIVFVGGAIVLWTLVLLVLFILRY